MNLLNLEKLDWEQFSRELIATETGNGGNLMLPFFGPEISPRVDFGEPRVLGGFAGDWKQTPLRCGPVLKGNF